MDAADLDDGSDGNDPPSAPSEFLAEFLSAIMQRQYAEALKYCRLILQYEPHNATARGFYPLLQHKVAAQHDAAPPAALSDEARCGGGSSSPDSAPRGPASCRRGGGRSRSPKVGRHEVMEQEADEVESFSRSVRSRSRSSSASDDSCASQSSLEPDSSLSAGASLERSDSASGGWESGGTAGSSGGTVGSSGGTAGSSGGTAGSSGSAGAALAASDDNGNALPATPSPTGGLHSDDMENDNEHTAPVKNDDVSAASLRRLRAQFACSIK